MTRIQLSEHFTYKKLLKFCSAPVVMMVFTSIYGVVDGLFVSNFTGKTPFAAINLIFPFLMILGGFGFMIGSGGTALIGKTLGEGKREKANQYLTMLLIFTIVLGVILSVVGIAFLRPIARFLGATENMIDDCVLYGRIVLVFNTCFMLQNIFQVIFPVAEKQRLGLYFTLAGGITNIILDALFIGLFKWGIVGAAVATGISQSVAGVLPVFYFLSKKNNSLLHLAKTKLEFRPIAQVCGNGISELMSSVSSSIVSIVYNMQLLKYAGENGVAAYSVLMYLQFVFIAIFIGYTVGTSPIISYHFGAENHTELKNLLKKSLILNIVVGALMMSLAIGLSLPLAKLFVGYDQELFAMTLHAVRLVAMAFIIIGVNIFISSFFTALNNGIISGIISVLRTLVFKMSAALILPLWLGIEGIWVSIIFSEIMALIISLIFLITKRQKYHY